MAVALGNEFFKGDLIELPALYLLGAVVILAGSRPDLAGRTARKDLIRHGRMT
jgi:hypothetical protein